MSLIEIKRPPWMSDNDWIKILEQEKQVKNCLKKLMKKKSC